MAFCGVFRGRKCDRSALSAPTSAPATLLSTQMPNEADEQINQQPTPGQPFNSNQFPIDQCNQTAGGGVHSSPRRPRARGCSPTLPSTSATSSQPCSPRMSCTLDTCRCFRSASRPLRDASGSTRVCGSRGRFTRLLRLTRFYAKCATQGEGEASVERSWRRLFP